MTRQRPTPEQRAVLERWPAPPDTPIEALRHTLDLYPDADDDRIAVSATVNLYPRDADGQVVTTGLTFGDLRALLTEIERLRTRLVSEQS